MTTATTLDTARRALYAGARPLTLDEGRALLAAADALHVVARLHDLESNADEILAEAVGITN